MIVARQLKVNNVKRPKLDQEPNPKLVRRLGAKLAAMLVILSVVSVVSILPEFLNAQANTADTKPASRIRTVIVLGPSEAPKADIVRLRQCRPGSQCLNGKDRISVVVLKSGKIPSGAIRAVVETDTDCTPDANGISHCNNRLRFFDGQSLDVRHDHNMKIYPCLTPGETVELKPQISLGGRSG